MLYVLATLGYTPIILTFQFFNTIFVVRFAFCYEIGLDFDNISSITSTRLLNLPNCPMDVMLRSFPLVCLDEATLSSSPKAVILGRFRQDQDWPTFQILTYRLKSTRNSGFFLSSYEILYFVSTETWWTCPWKFAPLSWYMH